MPSPQNNYGQVSGFATPSMDGTILLFVALVALATTMVFGAAPALSASGADPADTLAVSSRGVAGRGRGRALTVLVTSQIAVAVLLLGGALLLGGTVVAAGVRPVRLRQQRAHVLDQRARVALRRRGRTAGRRADARADRPRPRRHRSRRQPVHALRRELRAHGAVLSRDARWCRPPRR
jgi:hypothetical protein